MKFAKGSPEEEAFRNSNLSFKKPIAGIIMAMQIVAFEDYFRQIFEAINNVQGVEEFFPRIKEIERDKYGDYFKPSNLKGLNETYEHIFEFKIIEDDIDKIQDLVQIRHLIFHFGGLIKPENLIDSKNEERFKYYSVHPGEIDPPYKDVLEISNFICGITEMANKKIRDGVCHQVIEELKKKGQIEKDWINNPPKIIIDLVEIFNYFDFIPLTQQIYGTDGAPKFDPSVFKQELIDQSLKYLQSLSH